MPTTPNVALDKIEDGATNVGSNSWMKRFRDNLDKIDTALGKVLPASNGTDDTTWLNTALASGGRFRGTPGQTYLQSGPLVIPSDTELDMTGCTIRLLSGSSCNNLINQATNTVRRVLDVVTTASSTTVTSA